MIRLPILRAALLAVFVCGALVASVMPGYALQYRLLETDDDDLLIAAEGAIVKGDLDRLRDFIRHLPHYNFIRLALDSPGGNVAEAEALARSIYNSQKISVLVRSNQRCVSACFLLLAAADEKAVAVDAQVGVHSTSSIDGEEDLASMGITTAMAREASGYLVPPSIIGRMVSTPPDQVAWLTHDELAQMYVAISSSPERQLRRAHEETTNSLPPPRPESLPSYKMPPTGDAITLLPPLPKPTRPYKLSPTRDAIIFEYGG